jgi:hypothetical protein
MAIAQDLWRNRIGMLIGKKRVGTVADAIEAAKEHVAAHPHSVTYTQISRCFFGL